MSDMRKPRILLRGASYHVIARANRNETIMRSAEFKEMFLKVMAAALRKHHFSYYGFCLLDDQIHFIIKPFGRASLSKIMQWILSVFAMRYNRRMNFRGHVWYDRFKSRALSDFFQYLDTYIFVLKRPVALGLCRNPSSYPYNDLNECFVDLISIYQPP
ncbi:MAG: transposase [Spirochaetales bacterium]|nr:transposase [Spirochaetales bacterium]